MRDRHSVRAHLKTLSTLACLLITLHGYHGNRGNIILRDSRWLECLPTSYTSWLNMHFTQCLTRGNWCCSVITGANLHQQEIPGVGLDPCRSLLTGIFYNSMVRGCLYSVQVAAQDWAKAFKISWKSSDMIYDYHEGKENEHLFWCCSLSWRCSKDGPRCVTPSMDLCLEAWTEKQTAREEHLPPPGHHGFPCSAYRSTSSSQRFPEMTPRKLGHPAGALEARTERLD